MLHNAAENVSGWEWQKLEYTINEDYAEIAAQIAAVKPDLLGCSLYIFNFNAVMEILGRFHVLFPAAEIVLGGPECAGDAGWKLLEKFPFIKTVFRGEAEGFFAEYLQNFPAKKREVIPSDKMAVYEKWHEKFPVDDCFFSADKAFVQIETSRGCPMGCKYCTSSNIPLRLKELSDVEKELSHLYAKGVREVRLLDRTFNFPQWRGAALLKLFREKFPDVEFHLEIHPQFLDDELKNELKIAPKLHIEAGIQSFDEKVQRAIGRNSKKDEVSEGVKFLASCKNFETHVDLICGLPEQTPDSVLSDVAELINFRADEIQLETLKILHGTPLERETGKWGIIYSPFPPYDVMQTATFPAAEILYTRKVSRILDLFYNHAALREVCRRIGLKNASDVRIFVDFMIEHEVDFNRLFDLKKRVLYLIGFLKKYPSVPAEFEIAKLWIEQGYPQNELPFGKICRFEGTLPDFDAETQKILSRRETKLWQLKHCNFVMNFAVNRHFKLNGAAFVW